MKKLDDSEPHKPFSEILNDWLHSEQPKTIARISDIFAERSFAIAFLILMSPAALPLPTAGITHFFEIITILLALELLVGMRTIWLPKRWRNNRLGEGSLKKIIPGLIKVIRWFEKFSRPRFKFLIENQIFLRTLSLVVIIFSAFALIAPPFSWLDTLPALGVVIIALGIILYDALLLLLGLISGIAGISLIIFFAAAITHFFRNLF
jgi:hypothetical protein